ncbi:hypothetical protein GOP47_0029396 [Adiantum capillus-veneris]|nr:hypothetical protein GOP47_0029396 [Adiantum capillus-veneris]
MFCKGPVKWALSSLVLRASIGELTFGKCSGGMSLPCPREPFTGGIMMAMSVTAFYAQAIPATEPIQGAFINLDLLVASRPGFLGEECNDGAFVRDQGLEWIELVTSSSPRTTFLAGKNSVYRGIPKQVTAAAFNVDEEQLRELGRDEEDPEDGNGYKDGMAALNKPERAQAVVQASIMEEHAGSHD